MPRKLTVLQAFYIDNNLGLSDTELVKTTGCSLGQVKARRKKIQGINREGNLKGTEEHPLEQIKPERQAQLENKSQKQAAAEEAAGNLAPVTNQGRPAPAMRIDALIARDKGVTIMTGPASELADLFDGNTPGSPGPMYPRHDPFADETKVYRMKK